MNEEPNLLERLADLERMVITQSDRISALEDELRGVHTALITLRRRTQPKAEAA